MLCFAGPVLFCPLHSVAEAKMLKNVSAEQIEAAEGETRKWKKKKSVAFKADHEIANMQLAACEDLLDGGC